MSKQALLPSPNWFLNSLADCALDGTLAYGCRNGIVLVRSINFSEGCAASPTFSLIPNAHRDKERVTALAFSNRSHVEEGAPFFLASSGDDGAVAIWDISNLELIQKHSEHHHPTIGLDWSKTGNLLLVSADDKGHFAVWDLARNDLRVLPILAFSNRLTPNVLKCSPVNQDIVAVGCKDGLVCMISIKGNGSLLSRMRGHDKSVTSLSWCPGTSMLASSGLDQNIIVWNNGQAEKTIQLPNKSISGVVKVKPGEKSNSILWSPVLFLKPDEIISGCSNAEVISWNPQKETPTPTLLHSDHTRGLFCLAFNGSSVWSLAQDRLLIHHDLSTKTTTTFPTLGGFAYCIAPCPFAPGRVAIGVGDETIRVWSLTDNTGKSSVSLWQRIKGKVHSLAWHPEKEGELAFGTSDGRVGIFNASNPSKEPLIMRHFHRQGVYRVTWGPPVHISGQECPPNKWYLYACDENASAIYTDNSSAPILLRIFIKAANPQIKDDRRHKDLAWKSDRSLLALGLEDGTIQLLTAPHLHCMHTILSHKKMVFFLSWHPSSTAVNAVEEKRQNWLASASMDQMINVFDVSPLQDDNKEWKGASLPLKPMSEMKHGGKVVCLAWNPHIGGQLLSSSYEASVKMWDATKGELLACYVEHNGCVLSCCWSPLDPGVVISGAADFTCRTWKLSEAPADSKPAARSKHREEMKGESMIPPPTVSSKPEGSEIKLKANDAPRGRHQERLPAAKPTKVTIFPLLNASLAKNSIGCCYNMLQSQFKETPEKIPRPEVNGQGDIGDTNHFGYFDNQEAALALFDKEAEALKKMNNFTGLNHLKIWQGDLQQIIKDAIKAKKLDDWLVSMSPSVSHKFWLDTCSSYADQLVEDDKTLKAASYFLMALRVEDAVVNLSKKKLFKEAVAICHLRLSDQDPLLHQTLCAWGKYSLDSGNYEIAMQCFIATGEYEKAAIVLGKRKDSKLWQLGIYLAKLAEAHDLAASMTVECFYNLLMNQEWEAAKELIHGLPDMKHLEYLLSVHEMVNKKEKDGLDMAKVWNNDASIIDQVEEIFTGFSDEQYQHLMQMFPICTQLPDNRKELLIATSKLLLLAGAGKVIGDADWERYVVLALHLNYRRSLVLVKEKPLHLLLSWLRTGQLSKFQKSEECFRAAAYIGCLNKDDPELFPNLVKYGAALMDAECARFARLEVMVPDLEKKLAAAQVERQDITELQMKLLELKTEKDELENARAAFPNPFILFCKLQNIVDSLQDKVDKQQLHEFESKMDAFRLLIQG